MRNLDQPFMSIPTKSFLYKGRMYWFNEMGMEIINYASSHSVTEKMAGKALKIDINICDLDTNDADLYREYVKGNAEAGDDEFKSYIKTRLWNIIDNVNSRGNDVIKAMEMLVNMTIRSEAGEQGGLLKKLTFEELSQLLDKISR